MDSVVGNRTCLGRKFTVGKISFQLQLQVPLIVTGLLLDLPMRESFLNASDLTRFLKFFDTKGQRIRNVLIG